MPNNVRIAITPGEPAGVGPELTLKLAKHALEYQIVAIANLEMLSEQAKQLNMNIQLEPFNAKHDSEMHRPGILPVVDIEMPAKTEVGKLNVKNSVYVVKTLNTAVDLIQQNVFQALTTAPVQKSIINDAGIAFTGHTEFLAEKTGGYPVMLLTNEYLDKKTKAPLRVALVTTHIPLNTVTSQITIERIQKVVQVLHQDLIERFAVENPCIAVCGLNPHAGEAGHLGLEEIEIIIPALEELRQHDMNIVGPIPADTAFTQQQLQGKHAVVAMYHDQGLPVIKHQGFGEVVNVTLGLPIIRTSVDHGTALDIAGQGIADESSLLAATNLAARLCA